MQRSVSLYSLALLMAGIASAQTAGRISGQIMDQTLASIPGAKVVAENTGTGARREIVTDQQGRYVFADLPIGKYKVMVDATGFQSQVRSELQLNVASVLSVDFTLPAGTLTQAVEVKGQVETVDPLAANGQLMGNRSVMDLPINGRDYARFSLLTPGAVSTNNFIAMITFNGMQSIHNQFSIDGVDASRVDQPYMANGFERGARLLTGSLDTVEEFRVQTSN
ncbi:MAG: carboxypeptidase-like regulatory domain-containing protein, partial [Bryobacteraceae bacterium]